MSARALGRLRPWLAALALLAGCGGAKHAPTAPEVRLGPALEAVFPAARSTRVALDTPIWARFREPLDPASVTVKNVFLKHDTQRLAIGLAYDAPTRTLRIVPLAPLALRHTYTIELTPRLATAAGGTLDTTSFWQFTTTSLRRLAHPSPADGAVGQSPFAALGWDANDPAAGTVAFDVVSGDDSTAVATRAASTTLTTTYANYLMADARRGFLSTRFWSVRATNLDTGEQQDGPVWRYAVVAADAPVDSVNVPAKSFCSVRNTAPNAANCNAVGMSFGTGTFNAAIRWNLELVPPTRRLAGAVMTLWPTSVQANTGGAAVLPVAADFDGCQATYAGPPNAVTSGGVLANAVLDPGTGGFVYRDDRFTAHLQCALAFGAPHGYALISSRTITVNSPASANLPSVLRLYYYRDPPGVPAATMARASHPGAPRR